MIYTIGYGNRPLADFVALLRQYDIQYVADVRSKPYSARFKDFSKKALAANLKAYDLGYLYMGEQLGGKPDDESFFTEGRVDYGKLSQADFFRTGLTRLQTALDKGYRVALMCAELKPERCHRTHLVGAALTALDIPVQHIDENGVLRSQDEVVLRLTAGQLSLFE